MTWSKTPPTKPGLYYWRQPGSDRIVQVVLHDGRLVETVTRWSVYSIAGEWGPRIPSAETLAKLWEQRPEMESE